LFCIHYENKAKDFPNFEDVAKWKASLKLNFEWLEKAHGALNKTKPLDVNGFTDLVTEAEKLNVDNSILKKLKNQLKLAKAWRLKVKKTGLEKGKATTSQLRELLPEATSLLVDLSDELDVIKMATAQHCICRKPHTDGLITCNQCQVQYHKTCVAAETSDAKNYLCARCVLRALYVTTVGNIVSTCDKWACNISPENFNTSLPLPNTASSTSTTSASATTASGSLSSVSLSATSAAPMSSEGYVAGGQTSNDAQHENTTDYDQGASAQYSASVFDQVR
jgi:hypothetical protein